MPNSAAALAWVRWCSLIRSLTRSASCTRSLRSPASANPRSTNTSPVPAETVSRFLVLLTIAHLIVGSRQLQALANQFDIFPGRTNSRGGFFLKAMQHVVRGTLFVGRESWFVDRITWFVERGSWPTTRNHYRGTW